MLSWLNYHDHHKISWLKYHISLVKYWVINFEPLVHSNLILKHRSTKWTNKIVLHVLFSKRYYFEQIFRYRCKFRIAIIIYHKEKSLCLGKRTKIQLLKNIKPTHGWTKLVITGENFVGTKVPINLGVDMNSFLR